MHVPALENRPSIVGFEWLWEAFIELSTCRQIGMALGKIPWTAMREYVEAHGYCGEEAYVLRAVVRHLDELFLKSQEEKK